MTQDLAGAVQRAIQAGFEAQAMEHGRGIHKRAVETRGRCERALFMLDTFDRQVKERGERARAAVARGDLRLAQEQATAAIMARDNAARIRAAIEGVD